jgi:hypothetical protein
MHMATRDSSLTSNSQMDKWKNKKTPNKGQEAATGDAIFVCHLQRRLSK